MPRKARENDDQARKRHENRAQEGCADEAGSCKEAGKVEQDQADGRSQSGARERRSQTDNRQHDDCRGDEGGSSEEQQSVENGAVPARGQGIAFGWAIGIFAGDCPTLRVQIRRAWTNFSKKETRSRLTL